MNRKYRNNLKNIKFPSNLAAIGSLLLTVFIVGVAIAQDIELSASVDRTNIELGESIELTVSVAGPVRSIEKPLLPDLSAFDIYSSGTSSNISIVPGSISYQTDYTYILVPRKQGTFTIDPVTVEHKGRAYATKPIKITVGAQAQQQPPTQQRQPQQTPRTQQQPSQQTQQRDDFFIEQVVDNSRPYVGQQITLIFRFYQSENLYEQPVLNWPSFNGFWVEDLPPNNKYNKRIGGKAYRVTEIRKALFPTVSGKLRIEPSKMTIPPQAWRDPFDFFNRRRTQKYFAEKNLVTKGITINVRELPSRGKPENFAGAVGTYTFRVFLDQDTVEIDQPIALKAIVSGNGNIKKLPTIEIPDLENFRLYDSGTNESISKQGYKVSGSKSFEWVLIPTTAGEYILPELRFSYFDPWSEKYKTSIKTPGQVVVKPTSITSMNPGDMPVNVIPAATKSLNYIVTDLSNNKSGKALYQLPIIWILQIIPLAWIVGLTLYVNYRKRLEGDTAYARRVMATKAAKKALSEAREGFDSPEKFYGRIYNGIVGFISDKLNVSASGMTNAQIIDMIKNTGKCDSIVEDFDEFLKRCDAGRFSPSKPDQAEMSQIYDKAERLLSELDRGLK